MGIPRIRSAACLVRRLLRLVPDHARALSQGMSRGRRTDLAAGLLAAATIKVLAGPPGHLLLSYCLLRSAVLRKGSSLFVRGNPESLGQAARQAGAVQE